MASKESGNAFSTGQTPALILNQNNLSLKQIHTTHIFAQNTNFLSCLSFKVQT